MPASFTQAEVRYQDDWLTIWHGDTIRAMRQMPARSVHCAITSPPYYTLRDYGIPPSEWTDGWVGCLGMEPTPQDYVRHIVMVCEAVRRVLRDDGTFWLNLGDTYAEKDYPFIPKGNLIGIPWAVAFALRQAGWVLRTDVVWSKPNVMPEKVYNRPTRSHEFVFLLTKTNSGYFYDHHAIKEPVGESMKAAAKRAVQQRRQFKHDEQSRGGKSSPNRMWSDPATVARILQGRNKRDVWDVPTINYDGTQDATFPPELIEPMILAGTSAKGCCALCGTQYQRDAEGEWYPPCAHGSSYDEEVPNPVSEAEEELPTLFGSSADEAGDRAATRLVRRYILPETVPATVLDPFGGSGTVGMVAQQHMRRAVLIDLNDDYIKEQMLRNSMVPIGI